MVECPRLMTRYARLLRKFVRLTRPDRRLLVEAWFLLGMARLAIALMPFRRLARRLGAEQNESPGEISPDDLRQAMRTRWAVATASRHTIWRSNCFPQAIAAKYLLHRRGIDSTLYLGAGFRAHTRLEAHAWLRCGSIVVTGAAGRGEFTPLGVFGPVVPRR